MMHFNKLKEKKNKCVVLDICTQAGKGWGESGDEIKFKMADNTLVYKMSHECLLN